MIKGKPMVKKSLIRPYFWGGVRWPLGRGGRLTSHNIAFHHGGRQAPYSLRIYFTPASTGTSTESCQQKWRGGRGFFFVGTFLSGEAHMDKWTLTFISTKTRLLSMSSYFFHKVLSERFFFVVKSVFFGRIDSARKISKKSFLVLFSQLLTIALPPFIIHYHYPCSASECRIFILCANQIMHRCLK